MDKRFIVANLKSHMNTVEAKNWINVVLEQVDKLQELENKEIIISPSFTLLPIFNSYLKDTNIKIASQDLSPFDEGAYTGEVNAKQIKDYASYVIIGHSERRNNFNEIDDVLFNKTKMAIKYGLKPIYCVQNQNTIVPEGVEVIAYEPIFAIGSGTSDTPQNAELVFDSYKIKNNNFKFLYGGSVTSENVALFTKGSKIKGVLVGGASLDPQEFIKLIKNA